MDQDDFSNLPDDVKAKAMTALNEDGDRRQYCVDSIKEWIVNNDEINCRTDTSFILRFLRVCKFDEEKVKKRIKNYVNVRKSYSKWFDWSDESEDVAVNIMQSCFYAMNYEGSCLENILILNAGDLDTKMYNVEQLSQTTTLLLEVLLENPRLQVAGVHMVVNFHDVGLSLISQMSPRFLWRFISFWQFTMPVRIKGIHLVNAPTILNGILAICRSFLTKKLKERLLVHKSYSSLITSLSADSLPCEFDGTAGPAQKFKDATVEILKSGKKTYLLESKRYTSVI